jgi:flagella basal body P-ring formation protein FlgA
MFEVVRAPARSPACVALVRPLAAGEALAPGDVEPAECGEAPGALRFDRRKGAVIAAAPLAAGTPLGALRLEAAPAIAAGSELTLVSRAGPVSIARDVVALQSGRAGGRVFVRDADGTVIAAPVAEGEDPQ